MNWRAGGFRCSTSSEEAGLVLRLSGEMDVATIPQFREAVAELGDGQHLTIDATELEFIDSTGLAAILDLRRELGLERFRLIPGPACRRVIELTGVQELLGLE